MTGYAVCRGGCGGTFSLADLDEGQLRVDCSDELSKRLTVTGVGRTSQHAGRFVDYTRGSCEMGKRKQRTRIMYECPGCGRPTKQQGTMCKRCAKTQVFTLTRSLKRNPVLYSDLVTQKLERGK